MQPLNLRPFRGSSDFALLADILTKSEHADHLPLSVSGTDLARDWQSIPRFDPFYDLIIGELEGCAVGFGRVRWSEDPTRRTYSLAGYVLPESRRKGVGRALLGWLEQRASEIAAEHLTSLPAFLHVNTTQYQVGLQALARWAGYQVKESWVLMVRPNLEDISELPLPEGLELRPALPEHYGAIWRAVGEAYEPLGGPPPSSVLPEDMRNDPNFQPDLWQVAWDVATDQIAGSVMTYINHAENKALGIRRGFTEGISTVPRWQRRGVAKALIARSLKVQRELGMTESALVCSGENLNNYRLYQHCGFNEVKRDTVYEKSLG